MVGRALWRYPHVVDFCRNKAPECAAYVDAALALVPHDLDDRAARQAETDFLRYHETFVVYAWPEAMEQVNYIADWDRKWLDELIDLCGMVVLDVGAGTGRLALRPPGMPCASMPASLATACASICATGLP